MKPNTLRTVSTLGSGAGDVGQHGRRSNRPRAGLGIALAFCGVDGADVTPVALPSRSRRSRGEPSLRIVAPTGCRSVDLAGKWRSMTATRWFHWEHARACKSALAAAETLEAGEPLREQGGIRLAEGCGQEPLQDIPLLRQEDSTRSGSCLSQWVQRPERTGARR